MPRDEIHYFSRHYHRGEDWYARHFEGVAHGQQLAENSNSYLTEEGALARIAAEQPQAKILCLVRNPIERAYSSYGMQVDRGRATSDIHRYLDPERSPRPHILTNGLYAGQLAPWYKAFPQQRIMIARYDDIISEPASLYRRVLAFLSLDDAFVPTSIGARENARKKSGIPGPLKRALWWARPALNTPPIQAWLGGAAGKRLHALISRPKRYPPLTSEIRARLTHFYRADVAALTDLTGQDFSHWLSDGETPATGGEPVPQGDNVVPDLHAS